MKRLLILALIFANFTLHAGAFAQTPDCKVPVCDIPAQIELLRNANQNDRYQFVLKLTQKFHNSDDAVALQNLRQFGNAAMKLFVEVREEDWLVRAAKTLRDESLVGLGKYERPVTTQNLVDYYLELGTMDNRFTILAYWTGQIAKIDDLALLSTLIEFATAAKKISLAAKEDEYMIRQCEQILEKASTRYTQVNPFHEGLYSVDIQCRRDPRVLLPCSKLVMSIDRMVVLDTQYTNGLVVTFSDTKSDVTVFQYDLSSFSDSLFQGITRQMIRPSQFNAKIDRTTGIISGTLTTTQSMGINYDFVARPMRTGLDFQNRGISLDANEDIAGLYRGSMGEQTGQFIIRRFADETYRASWITNEDNYFQIDFQTEVTVSKQGLLAFAAHPNGRPELKLFMQKTQTAEGIIWSGFYLMPSGRVNEVRLMKIAPENVSAISSLL